MITAGRLAVRLAVRLLANDAARQASQPDRLAATLALDAGGRRVTLSFPGMQVAERREIVDPSGGPSMIHLGLQAETGRDGLMLVRQTEGQS